MVSDRNDVVCELEPMIRDQGHLMLTVSDAYEALNVFDEGLIPDLVISDSGSAQSAARTEYLTRFRDVNDTGQHLVVLESNRGDTQQVASSHLSVQEQDTFAALPRPFSESQVRDSLQWALGQVWYDLRQLHGGAVRGTQRLQAQARAARTETAYALALVIEAKDPYMRGHCARVANLAQRMATRLGVDAAERDRLYTAARLHEIGKISVPLELLHKSTPLSTAELTRIRGHAEAGARILGAIPSLSYLAPLIAHHVTPHSALADHSAPDAVEFLLISILRVADAYDAMTSDRASRTSLSPAEAVALLESGADTAFHPGVVRTLLNLEPA
jgi:HD-GYP domain-containing protein (c-di-GMP phosphodiesterase class II)